MLEECKEADKFQSIINQFNGLDGETKKINEKKGITYFVNDPFSHFI